MGPSAEVAARGLCPAGILTFTGRRVDLTAPKPEDVDVEDVAHALAHLCRFGGHSARFYSVAEHSVLVSYVVPRELAVVGLLHDAHEAYLGDVVSPLKDLLPGYRELCAGFDRAIGARFGVTLHPLPRAVREADLAVLYEEVRCLFGRVPRDLFSEEVKRDSRALLARREVLGLPPAAAKSLFVSRCLELVT